MIEKELSIIKFYSIPFKKWFIGFLSVLMLSTQIFSATSFADANGYATAAKADTSLEYKYFKITLRNVYLYPNTNVDLLAEPSLRRFNGKINGDEISDITPVEVIASDGEKFLIPKDNHIFVVPPNHGVIYTIIYVATVIHRKPKNATNSDASQDTGSNVNRDGDTNAGDTTGQNANQNANQNPDPNQNASKPKDETGESSDSKDNTGQADEREVPDGEVENDVSTPSNSNPDKKEDDNISKPQDTPNGSTKDGERKHLSEQDMSKVPDSNTLEQKQEIITPPKDYEESNQSQKVLSQVESSKKIKPNEEKENILSMVHSRVAPDNDGVSFLTDTFIGKISYDGSKLSEKIYNPYVEIKVPIQMLQDNIEGYGLQISNTQKGIKEVIYLKETDNVVARVYLSDITNATKSSFKYQVHFKQDGTVPDHYILKVEAGVFDENEEILLDLEEITYGIKYPVFPSVLNSTLQEEFPILEKEIKEDDQENILESNVMNETKESIHSPLSLKVVEEREIENRTPNKPIKRRTVAKFVQVKDIQFEFHWVGDILYRNLRPNDITITLLRQSSTIKEEIADRITITNPGIFADIWTGAFKELPVFDEEGNSYEYKIQMNEDDISSNYINLQTLWNSNKTKVILTGKYHPQKVKARILWDDNSNEHQVRPYSVDVVLQRSIDEINFTDISDVVSITAPQWTHSFGTFPRTDEQGNTYIYRIKQLQSQSLKNYTNYLGVSSNYQFTKAEDTIFLTNSINEISIPISVIWKKEENTNFRPSKISLVLERSGNEHTTLYHKNITGSNSSDTWGGIYQGLVAYDSKGRPFTYTLSQTQSADLRNYQTTIEGNHTIHNTFEKTSHTVKILWVGERADEKERLHSVRLYRGVMGKAKELVSEIPTMSIGSYYTFINLPKYNEEGVLYEYTVKCEKEPLNYQTKYEQIDDSTTLIYHTFAPKHLDVNVVFLGDELVGRGARPEQVKLKLNRMTATLPIEEVIGSQVTLDITGNQARYRFENLPYFSNKGEPYQYTVEQIQDENLKKYSSRYENIDGDSITVNNIYAQDTIKVRIDWVDNNNVNQVRPDMVRVQLRRRTKDSSYENIGTPVILTQFNPDSTQSDAKHSFSSWQYIFQHMPQHDPQGQEYIYDVVELEDVGLKNYPILPTNPITQNGVENQRNSVKMDDGTLVITNVLDTTKIPVHLEWEGIAPYKPDSVKVNLQRKVNGVLDETFLQTKMIQGSHWKGEFEQLAKYDKQGNIYEYIISEELGNHLKNFTVSNTKQENGVYIITNIYNQISIVVKTIWEDYNNQLKVRPDKVTLVLLRRAKEDSYQRNFTSVDNYTYDLTASDFIEEDDNIWMTTFENLPKYDPAGYEYEYSVDHFPNVGSELKNYITTVSDWNTKEHSITITNQLQTVAVEVESRFYGDANQKEYRPKNIELKLYRSNYAVKNQLIFTKYLTSFEDTWTTNFDKLPIFDRNGNQYVYHVEQIENGNLQSYDTTLNTEASEGYKFVFDNILSTNVITTQVYWEDFENQYGIRPNTVEIVLERKVKDGEFVAVGNPVTISAPNWIYNFGTQPKMDMDGNIYTYQIRELDSQGLRNYPEVLSNGTKGRVYTKTGMTFVVTNTLQTIDIPIKLLWESENRPEKVKVTLTRTGTTPIPTYTNVLEGENSIWNGKFENLIAYDVMGNEFTYTLSLPKSEELERFHIGEQVLEEGVRTIYIKEE